MSAGVRVVIGGAYGDEGKGLATDLFSAKASPTIVIKHNGGAQAGHTVELPEGKRFVFHALSAGSFRGADTLWADTFLPDLYKLSEEVEEFRELTGTVPHIYACEDTCVTLIDDVLMNMAAETARGEARHGSCGMGIYEATLRSRAGFGITVKQVKEWGTERLVDYMKTVRRDYLPKRLKELGLTECNLGEYGELLSLEDVLKNAATEMKRGGNLVTLIRDKKSFVENYGNIIFESGQGLLLDWDWKPGLPYVSASKTGLTNPMRFLESCGLEPEEVIYVIRSYLTRHGAGPLPHECGAEAIGEILKDETNVPNPWQGNLRYSLHASPDAMLAPIREDRKGLPANIKVSLLITHLNETAGRIAFATGKMSVDEFIKLPDVKKIFHRLYLSSTKYAQGVTETDL